jgi:hypothetical protein
MNEAVTIYRLIHRVQAGVCIFSVMGLGDGTFLLPFAEH